MSEAPGVQAASGITALPPRCQSLVSTPDDRYVTYDEKFGQKVYEGYELRLWRIKVRREVTQSLREQKYVSTVALSYEPGNTPVQIRMDYARGQAEMEKACIEATTDDDELLLSMPGCKQGEGSDEVVQTQSTRDVRQKDYKRRRLTSDGLERYEKHWTRKKRMTRSLRADDKSYCENTHLDADQFI